MRLLYLPAVAVAVAVHASSASAAKREDPDSPEALKNCQANQFTLTMCSMRRHDRLGNELDELYKARLAGLKGGKRGKRLAEAQELWSKYIEADCVYRVGSQVESGSAWAADYNDCLSYHIRQRIELMKDADTQFAYPTDARPAR